MVSTERPLASSAFGILAGALALIFFTATVVSAIASARADHRTESLATKLESVTSDLTDLRDEQAQDQVGTLKARANLTHQNEVLQYQIRVTQQQNRTLIRLLRFNGIAVPESSSAGSATRPKAPRRTSPGTPIPTGPSPSGPSPDPSLWCQLVPQLCGFPLSVPTIP